MSHETYPDLTRLWERLCVWQGEISHNSFPDRAALETALHLARKGGLDAELVLFVVAQCEWWFRTYRPRDEAIKQALQDCLRCPGYSPFRQQDPRADARSLEERYVEACLTRYWGEAASEQSRFLLQNRIPDLVRALSRPFLVTEYRALPSKQGGYPRLGHWVAATVLYQELREKHSKKQSSIPVQTALTVSEALTGNQIATPDFHKRRRAIEKHPAGASLSDTLRGFYRRIVRDYEDPEHYVREWLRDGPYHSLRDCGGWELLTGRAPDADEPGFKRENVSGYEEQQ